MLGYHLDQIFMQIWLITLIPWLYKIWGSRGLEESLGYDTGM
jgi:hypothetical protein